MKKLFTTLIAFLATTSFASTPIWVCKLDTRIGGTHAGVIFNRTVLGGTGTLSCTDTSNANIETREVAVRMDHIGIGLGFTRYRNNSTLRAYSVYVSDIDDLLGEFEFSLFGETTLVKNTERTRIRARNGDLAFNLYLSTQSTRGLSLSGLHSGILSIEELDQE